MTLTIVVSVGEVNVGGFINNFAKRSERNMYRLLLTVFVFMYKEQGVNARLICFSFILPLFSSGSSALRAYQPCYGHVVSAFLSTSSVSCPPL